MEVRVARGGRDKVQREREQEGEREEEKGRKSVARGWVKGRKTRED